MWPLRGRLRAEGRVQVEELMCPWCESPLELAVEPVAEQQCPDCLTSWRYEEEEVSLAAAA